MRACASRRWYESAFSTSLHSVFIARSSSTRRLSSAATNAGSISRWIRSVGITSRTSDDRSAHPTRGHPAVSGQRRVRIDRAAVRAAGPDLEVQVRRTAGGVAGVADVTDHLTRGHGARAADVVAQVRVVIGVAVVPWTYAALPPSGSPWKNTEPLVTATSGVPPGENRSLPLWRAAAAARRRRTCR